MSSNSLSADNAAGANAIEAPNNVALIATDSFVCFIIYPLYLV